MSEIEFKDLTARPTTAGDSFVGIDSAGEAARITIPSSFSVGTAAYANLGTAGDEVPLNGDLGTAASVNTGTDPGNVPLNSDLGTAAYVNTGAGASDVPLNSNLGAAAYVETGTAAGEVPLNSDLGSTAYLSIGIEDNNGLYAQRILKNVSGVTIAAGATVAASAVSHIYFDAPSGVVVAGGVATFGSWKCLDGECKANEARMFVRVA